ncbi:MAG: TDP-4-keto-6-deoxy-D-glucose transaminase [Bryobacterales bacterium]|nr:TDP-4-keto-6-deoxy-D-glucose transaminase [Bryobacterales bacterium]
MNSLEDGRSGTRRDEQPSITFNRPFTAGNEYNYMRQAIDNLQISGDGPFTNRCHQLLEDVVGCSRALLTTSCTDALEMAALLLDIQPGDEVILPSFTFVSTANAFVLRGAKPVFIDVRPDTLNLDEKALERLITSRTKAIVPVHYAGVGCEMDAILEIASRHGVAVVEDNAHGLFGRYRGKNLGTFGQLATLSFHETKNISCGEGGALLINDLKHLELAEVFRSKGTNRNRFFRGQVDKYTWVNLGSSFLPSDLLAAFLYAQLEAREDIQRRRERLWGFYEAHLKAWSREYGVSLPVVPPHCDQAFHMFYLILPSLQDRHALIQHLLKSGISAVFHYVPLHLSDMGQRLGGFEGQCPVTEDISDRLLRLPFFNDLTESQQYAVVNALAQFDGWATKPKSARNTA